MLYKCTFPIHKILYEEVEANSKEEALAKITMKYQPLSMKGYFILEDEITFEDGNTTEIQTSGT